MPQQVQKGTFVPQGDQTGIIYWSPVTTGGNQAFVGFAESQSMAAGLFAFATDTGQELWHVPAQNLILPAPTYADGVVYFGESDGNVYAVDVETKSVKPGWPFHAEEAIWASPLVVGGRVYVASMDHHIHCLDAGTGQEIWKTEVGGALAPGLPWIHPGVILYAGPLTEGLCPPGASGAMVEGFDFQVGTEKSGGGVSGQMALTTSLDGIYALDPSSGAVIPPYPYDSAEINSKKDPIRAAPVQAGELIVVTTESGRVIAVKDAQRQWYWPSGVPTASILTTPVVSEGKVYVVLTTGQVQPLDAATGMAGWLSSQ